MNFCLNILIIVFLFQHIRTFAANDTIPAEVCIYGGTSAGIIAAIQLARKGKKVIIVEPSSHIGGMSVEGLGGSDINNHSDFKNDRAVGGLALEFYKMTASKYGIKNFEQERHKSMTWRFEPHVAEEVFLNWIRKYDIPLYLNHRLKLNFEAVLKQDRQIKCIETENGKFFKARIFIDATYEGDLLHFAGISTIIGRESNELYGESKNGIRQENNYRQIEVNVDPYNIPGDPSSGTIHTVQNEFLNLDSIGRGDHRIQAYCFRACLTKDPANRVPFKKPANYNRSWYEIYSRYAAAGGNLYSPSYSIPNNKTDLGAWHDLSHNLYGLNYKWPGGNYQEREEIYNYHLDFTRGLFYFLANDSSLPPEVNKNWSQWGTTRDEFTDNEGWPRMIYIRDGRRMVADYVITEHHTSKDTTMVVEDPVGIAYWPPDVHHVRRIINQGYAYNEGFVFGGNNWKPFQIAYRALIPRVEECSNLLTPTCLSSSHIAYGAIRLEWTFMILGQSVGAAANLCLEKNIPVQKLDYKDLKIALLKDGQVIFFEL
jgi:hypothetical protein